MASRHSSEAGVGRVGADDQLLGHRGGLLAFARVLVLTKHTSARWLLLGQILVE
jgi:hypothetical protein